MNKRLVELYKQATKTAYETVGVEHANTSYFQGIVTGMFAELIVRECMDVVDPGQNQVIARYQARQWLSEHFGVES